MRITSKISKWVTGAALAAALLAIAPNKAQAQVAFQIGVGSYGAPVYDSYGNSYGSDRDDWRRNRWIEREQEQERERQRAYAWQAEQAAEWRHQQWEQHERFEHRERDEDRGHYEDRGGYGFHDGPRY